MTMKNVTRYLRAALTDARLFVTGKRDRELPPHRYRRIGPGDYRKRGKELVALLMRNGLEPDHRVLDIGSGIGRVAFALKDVLSPNGSYDGFDIDARAVRWCVENITPRNPRFRFTHADAKAIEYRFPATDASFDFAFATSVFTHLSMDESLHYFREAHRVLRPGGILVATVFMWDGTPSTFEFPVDHGDHRLKDANDARRGIAFLDRSLDTLLPSRDWSDVRIERGGWQRGGTFSVLTQDVITARRR
ncbi:MAG TPA: class I SAM-dependent methyltransferase [Thermoanaerobaculia bacterium]|jgi:SAM-dependent methyltransferase|nr:class I SAM-dependent methyltransferase [Thermoanaerobaculia bacterium]